MYSSEKWPAIHILFPSGKASTEHTTKNPSALYWTDIWVASGGAVGCAANICSEYVIVMLDDIHTHTQNAYTHILAKAINIFHVCVSW